MSPVLGMGMGVLISALWIPRSPGLSLPFWSYRVHGNVLGNGRGQEHPRFSQA